MSVFPFLRKGCLVICILLVSGHGARAVDRARRSAAVVDETPGGESRVLDRLSAAFGHYRAGYYGEAAALLESFLAESPTPSEEEAARFLLGDCYWGAFGKNGDGSGQRALDVYRGALRAFPESTLAAKATFRMAEIHYRQGNDLKAIYLSRKISREHPAAAVTPWALHLHGKSLLAAKREAAGLHVLAEVIREYPRHPVVTAVRTSLVAHHMNRGDYPSALAQVRDLPPEMLTAEREMASVYAELLVRTERTGEARKILQLLVNRYPDDPHAPRWMALLGDAYRADGRNREAMTIYYELKTRFPDSEASVMAQAGILDLRLAETREGAWDEVDRAYGRLIAETGGAFEGLALVRRANMLFRTGRYGRALAEYQRFLCEFGGSRYFRMMTEDYGRALRAHLKGLYEQEDFPGIVEVAQTHRAALSGEAWRPELGWILAESHRRMSFYRGALRSLDRLRREDPGRLGDDVFVARLGESYLAVGEFEAAQETLKDFGTRFPGSRYGADVHALQARMAFVQGDQPETVRNARMSLTGRPPQRPGATRFLLAAAHWREGRREQSLKQFRQALLPEEASAGGAPAASVTAPARFAVADLLYELGRHGEALAAYQEAVAMLPDDPHVPWARYRIGRIQWHLDREAEALKTFEAIGEVGDETLARLIQDAKEELSWEQTHGQRP